MMIRINLIRHGKTVGNLKNRYIGTTDEPLCPEGIRELPVGAYAGSQAWFISPLRRCLETAALRSRAENLQCTEESMEDVVRTFLREENREIVTDFRECDFGIFENKNYRELAGCLEYQQWIDSGAALPFPKGEAPDAFRKRCCRAFEYAVDRICTENWQEVCMVVHGGTIMSIMERYAAPGRAYFDWEVKNAGGYRLMLDPKIWRERRQLGGYEALHMGN